MLFRSSFPQIRTLASPFPPVGSVAAPCGSPAVPHLRRYYEVVRLLQHPSVLPPVDPWLHVPPDPLPEAVLLVWEEMGSSLRFLGHPCGACPGLGTPPIPARPCISGRCRMLPSARLNTLASERYKISVLNPHGPLPCCLRFAPTSHPVNGKTRY